MVYGHWPSRPYTICWTPGGFDGCIDGRYGGTVLLLKSMRINVQPWGYITAAVSLEWPSRSVQGVATVWLYVNALTILGCRLACNQCIVLRPPERIRLTVTVDPLEKELIQLCASELPTKTKRNSPGLNNVSIKQSLKILCVEWFRAAFVMCLRWIEWVQDVRSFQTLWTVCKSISFECYSNSCDQYRSFRV